LEARSERDSMTGDKTLGFDSREFTQEDLGFLKIFDFYRVRTSILSGSDLVRGFSSIMDCHFFLSCTINQRQRASNPFISSISRSVVVFSLVQNDSRKKIKFMSRVSRRSPVSQYFVGSSGFYEICIVSSPIS